MTDANKELYYESHVFCCTNRREAGHARGCCAEKDAEKLRSYMKDKAKAMGIKSARINSAGCLDRCELGAVMVVYPEGVWYHYRDEKDIDEILESHIKGGKVVERLKLENDQKRF